MPSAEAKREPEKLPRTIGRYHILGHLASGGMAEVLLAKLLGPSGFERPVIIKRILPHLAKRTEFVKMFLDEARIIAAIRHPNVVQVQDLVHDGTELYLVMEYLPGESLAGIITRYKSMGERLDFALCAHIISEACAGLHAAHDLKDPDGHPREIVHRDISPQNIFVTYDGTTKVLDFGIAKASDRVTSTEAGQLKGKFAYMSPEQCQGLALDRRTDIFALGIVLYELSTQKRLFARTNAMKTLEAICYGDFPAPSTHIDNYPAELERVVLKALSKKREDRYQTAADMRRDLVGVVSSLGFQGIPEETLAAQMVDVFADRVAEKHELLRRVRSGSTLSHIPAAEIGSDLEAEEGSRPSLTKGLATSGVHRVDTSAGTSVMTSGKKRSAWWWLLAAAIIGTSFFIVKTSTKAPSPGQNKAFPEANSLRSDPVAERQTPPPAEKAKQSIALSIDSVPPEAEVSLDGEVAGSTPLTLELKEEAPHF
ncbi:MAG: serine/threonine protein kinase [Myxococcales bacterium]|nr:MAG: serine/threonine protein kinase [Myxococcales bacterium]